ncbi:chemotaxis protein CheD [Salsuginibacillus halophilus]|uniref:Probable chemoreceptor glutamine deamidase CheD n=1 Tax=Salsuginibacillus halophilus TaxID=517424 RepID=A0A2P8HY91_9BACI|nr:chemotaxis protein CheD [Salsuginibacillus halophilus]PSL51212.1 chemotaxis protein CheD [Salsuginibacillus halophilus]
MSETAANEIVKVGMAELSIATIPQVLRTSGLGSCVGIVLYMAGAKTAGMAHVMLPDSSMAREKAINRAKYADTAIEDLIELLKGSGMKEKQLKAKIAGGAEMFKFSSNSNTMKVGPRNVEAVKHELKSRGIEVTAEDTGGSSGRTIEFYIGENGLKIRTVNQGEAVI